MKTVQDFFDGISDKYTNAILQCVPRYQEMLWALLHYLSNDFKPKTILELGCGTGNLSYLIQKKFPSSTLTLIDISSQILAQCQTRLGNQNIQYRQISFEELQEPDYSYDLVISSIAIHHIDDQAKQLLFQKIFRILTPGGIFTYSDQFAGNTKEIYQKHMMLWQEKSLAMGASKADWQEWMEHQKHHDFHTPLFSQMIWLEQAGFPMVDCVWRYLLWSVIQAERKK